MNDSGQRDLKEVIQRAKAGDHEAFSYIYELYFKPVYRYLYFRTGSRDDSEEMAQDVFMKAYKSFANYTYSDHDPLAYFYTIARNTLIDRGRKKKILLADEEEAEDVADPGLRQDEELMRKEEAKELHLQIAQLPKDQQDVIILRFIEDKTTAETAAILGKREEAVRKLQSRGLHSLRGIFNGHE